MPHEESAHEGTWLQWPHNFTYGSGAEDVEASWVEMTKALAVGERVHIIAYDVDQVAHITNVLDSDDVNMAQVDFLFAKTTTSGCATMDPFLCRVRRESG